MTSWDACQGEEARGKDAGYRVSLHVKARTQGGMMMHKGVSYMSRCGHKGREDAGCRVRMHVKVMIQRLVAEHKGL